jgi:Arylsulfotransferase (ASST)
MEIHARTMTRRQLLRSAGLGAAGLTLTGATGELVAGALASSRSKAPPKPPSFHSRTDLQIPSLTVTRNDAGASTDAIFIAPYNAPNAQAGAVITDSTGEPIWENPVASKVTTNFRVQQYQGSPVLTWWEGIVELGHGVGEYVIADSSYRTIRRVQAVNGLRGDLHEFVLTPRGTALLTSYVVTHADLTSAGGSRDGSIQDAIFQEIDLASGELLLEWHSLGSVPPEESYAPVTTDWDFFHINSVDMDGDGNLLVSSRSMHTIYKVDRKGSIVWRLGGKSSDFEMGEGTRFAWQHHARRQADGTLTVFDNGATPAVEPLSRGLILDIDETAMTVGLLRQYTHPGILAGSQGSVQLLANGNVFVGWGAVPRVSEFQHSGRLVFDAVLGEKYESYRAFRMPWTGTPAQAPALAVKGAGRGMTAYASWNGATQVRSWQLLAGSQANALSPAASARATGFESALRTGSAGPYFAVSALDQWGRTLGSSNVVSVTS